MPICQNCGGAWSWKQTFKKSFTLDTGMKCPSCGNKQYLTAKSKRKSGIFSFLIPLTLLLPLLFNISLLATLGILVGVFLLLIGIYPILIELSNQEEHLW